jgi:hypothetical protein
VFVAGAEPPTVNAGGDPTITLPTSSITLNGTATGNNGATISSVFWELLSGPSWVKFSNEWALTTTVTGMVAGTYVFQLMATDNDGLTSTSTVTVVVNASSAAAIVPPTDSSQAAALVDSLNNANTLLLYPNPAHDLLNLRLSNTGTGKVLIVIYDAMGHKVQMVEAEKDQWGLQTSVDISRLAPGVYTIQVLTGTYIRTTSKFVKL